MTDPLVMSRLVPRYRGEPVPHDVEFIPLGDVTGFRPPAERAVCTCGDARTLDGPLSDADRERYRRQHGGMEDP